MSKNILICIDRDGTLINDNKYYLGSQKNWKKLLKILPKVSKGISLLNKKLSSSKIYIITNQSGVAIKSFPLLTKKKAEEVSQGIINLLKTKKAIINDYIICPHVSNKYTEEHKNLKFNKKFICNCSCIKPSPKMIREALKHSGFKQEETNIYVIGDRFIDVETAHNINGTGILIPFKNKSKEDIKLIRKNHKNEYISKNMLDAAKLIIRLESS